MKSLDFCKQIAKDPKRSNYSDRDWSKCEVIPSPEVFDRYIKGNRDVLLVGTNADGEKLKIRVKFNFEEDSDFDYLTSSTSVHDGTLIFITENFENCVSKLCQAQTYYAPTKKPPINKCQVTYTIGDFVMINEYDDEKFIPKETPFLRQRTTVMLPLKAEIEYDVIPEGDIGSIGEG
jgi:hypothetical protein